MNIKQKFIFFNFFFLASTALFAIESSVFPRDNREKESVEELRRQLELIRAYRKALRVRARRSSRATKAVVVSGSLIAKELYTHKFKRREEIPSSHLIHAMLAPFFTAVIVEAGEMVVEDRIKCPRQIEKLGEYACPLSEAVFKFLATVVVSKGVTAGLDHAVGPHHY